MTKEDVHTIILKIISEIAPDEDLGNIQLNIPLRDQLQLDSMDFLDIVMELRKKYGIEVPEQDYPNLVSLESCGNYLLPKFEKKA